MKKLLITILLISIFSVLNAATIKIPLDYPTIQEGINAAVNGDTVIVTSGTYMENINFNGKNITVGSLFLTTQDTTYISQTIIDGNQNGSVVTFNSGEDSTAVLYGFTITNGSAADGGGIRCRDSSSATIRNCIIYDNSALGTWNGGGGIYCHYYSSLTVINCVINSNSGTWGGGIWCAWYSTMSIINCTISNNIATNGGGIWCDWYESVEVFNSIFWGNTPSEVGLGAESSIEIFYSDVVGGWEGEGNIDFDPLFVDPINGNFHLSWTNFPIPDSTKSPCIDTGDPNSQLDPDGTISDMGSYYFDQSQITINADFEADPLSGIAPLTVQFTDLSTPQDSITIWEWDFDYDGTIDSYEQDPECTYTEQGTYTVSLTVSDGINVDTEIKVDYINVSTIPEQLLLSENFEDGILDSLITIETVGTFNHLPGIKDITNFGSMKAFGYGRSTCGSNCFNNYVTNFKITFPEPTYISIIYFKEMELYSNWGSKGTVYIDGIPNNLHNDFGRLPTNDGQPDTEYREQSFSINQYVTIIELEVSDITTSSEIFIDDLEIYTEETPILTVFPLSIDFGDVSTGETSTEQVTVTNTGNDTLNVSSVELIGENATNFSADTTLFILQPGYSQILGISFTPDEVGSYSASLEIESNGGNASVYLNGYGVQMISSIEGTWNELSITGNKPESRGWAKAIYDPIDHRIVLHGGWSSVPYNSMNDTWSFDLTTEIWNEEITTGNPQWRAGHIAVYDSQRHRMIIFAGGNWWQAWYNDVWSLDLSTNQWVELQTTGTVPIKRLAPCGVYDEQNDNLIVFGGNCDGPSNPWVTNEVWKLNLSVSPPEWTLVSTTGCPPSARQTATAVLDDQNNEMIIFGGNGCSDAWSLNLNTYVWIELEDYGSNRYHHASTFNSEARYMISVAGWGGPGYCDALVFDVDTNNWLDVITIGDTPCQRSRPALIYDPVGERVIMFGGEINLHTDFDDTWEFILYEAFYADFTADITEGEVPLEVQFTDLSVPQDSIVSWEWDFDYDGTIDSYEQNPEWTYNNPGTYTVSLTVTDEYDSTATETKVDYITVFPVPPTADFTADTTSGFTPLTINFTDQSTHGTGTIVEWKWYFGDEDSSSVQNPIHIYQNPGTYTVSLIVTDEYNSTYTETKIDYINVFGTVATPTFNPPAGTYNEPQYVKISCSTPDAAIHYTMDGTDPDENSIIYTDSILVDVSVTLKSIAYKQDWVTSQIAIAPYTIQGTAPHIELDPDSLAFGNVTIGEVSSIKSFYIFNQGKVDLDIFEISTPEAFEIKKGDAGVWVTNILDFIILDNSFQKIYVRFIPTDTGSYSGDISIYSNDPDEDTVYVNVSGTGVEYAVPNIEINPTEIQFGSVTILTSKEEFFTILNTGSAPLIIDSIYVPDNSGFMIRLGDSGEYSNFISGFSILVGTEKDLYVEFIPPAIGQYSTYITIKSNVGSDFVNVSGSGVEYDVPDIDVNPVELHFGDVSIYQSVEDIITIMNTGNAILEINNIFSLSGYELKLDDGIWSNNIPAFDIPPLEEEIIYVKFHPEALITYNGFIYITSNDPDEGSIPVLVEGQGIPVLSEKTPDAFTPNGDGLNDEFIIGPFKEAGSEQAKFKVFDLHGKLIHETNGAANEPLFWNGIGNSGNKSSSGAYIYVYLINNAVYKSGKIYLVR